MKLLRILTGLHAGAQLRLAIDGKYVVAAAEDADIEITDWPEEPLSLTVTSDDGVHLGRPGQEPDPATLPDRLTDLEPRRFGDVVLCVGPADEPWPSDLKLLEDMVMGVRRNAPEEPEQPPPTSFTDRLLNAPRGRLLLAGGIAIVALLGCFVSTVSGSGKAHAFQEPLHSRVTRAVAATGVVGVTVRREKDGAITVDGMVADSQAAGAVRAALQPFVAQHIGQRFSAASDVAQSISDALANPGLAVRYRGDGEFVVTGSSMDLDGVRGKLQRIVTDLGAPVAKISLTATELPPPNVLPTNAMMSSGDVQYVQTRDGTKHLTLRTLPEEVVLALDPPPPMPRAVAKAPIRHAVRPKRRHG
jgi:type III secretion protein D